MVKELSHTHTGTPVKPKGFPSPPSYNKRERRVASKPVGKLAKPRHTPRAVSTPKTKPKSHVSTSTASKNVIITLCLRESIVIEKSNDLSLV